MTRKSNVLEKMQKKWVFRHPLRSFFVVLGVLVLGLVGFLAWVSSMLLNEPLCNDWRVGMTRQEKIAHAVKIANQEPLVRFEVNSSQTGEKFFNLGRQIPYDSADTILSDQPECCKLYSRHTARTENPSEYLPEGDEGIVYLNYIGKYRAGDGQVRTAPISEYGDYNLCVD